MPVNISACTYVFKMDADEMSDPEVTRVMLQQILGPEHEVVSASSLSFPNSPDEDDAKWKHHVVKINTPTPDGIATRLMGEDWVRKDHIMYTTDLSSSSQNKETKTQTKTRD